MLDDYEDDSQNSDDEEYDYTNEIPLDEDDYEGEDYYEYEDSDEVACD